MLDVDGALKFLALEVALVNNDGYWTRASDYSIYLDTKGMFHLFPHDANETLPGGGGARHDDGPRWTAAARRSRTRHSAAGRHGRTRRPGTRRTRRPWHGQCDA